MEAITQRPKQSYKFDRKLTVVEIERLIEDYDYDPAYDQDEEREHEPIYDRYGNPTRDTIAAIYETRHRITHDRMTLDEFHEWMSEMCEETE